MKRKSILIVEDEAISAILLENILKSEYEIAGISSNGPDAIKTAIEKKPDLVLIDINLAGDISGIEVIMEISKSFTVTHIYCTAYTDSTIIHRANKTGPFTIIFKPVNIQSVKKSVSDALSS